MTEGEILVLEDEALIALDIQATLEDAGFDRVSVFARSEAALAHIEGQTPIAAFLDFNLGQDKTSVEVAEKLHGLGVPFVFLTGYTEATEALPETLRGARRLAKPFQANEVVAVAEDMTGR